MPEIPGSVYEQDGLRSVHNHDFKRQPTFDAAYKRGVQACELDYGWHWRVHVCLWAANVAAKLPGDFVECGVNKGFLASAIMHYLDRNSRDKTFYLLDTFKGPDPKYVSEQDKAGDAVEKNKTLIDLGFYTLGVEPVRKNFAEWHNVKIIPGSIPDTLDQIDSYRIAFASIDMNCSPPEVASMEFLWPRFIDGAVIVFDDYPYDGYRPQKVAMDSFAAERGVTILSLPTGQGLLIKTPA